MSVTVMLTATEQADADAVSYARHLAERLGVPLHGRAALPDPSSAMLYATSPYMIGVGGAAVEGVQAAQAELVQSLETMFKERTADCTVDAAFHHDVGTSDRIAAAVGALAEALVFPRPAGKGGHGLSVAFEHVLMTARLPVLLAGDKPETDGPALIAWDGSPQAARALRLNEGVIRSIGRVVIAQNPNDLENQATPSSADPALLAEWLGRRGVEATSVTFSGDVGKELLRLAASHGAAMLVAGGYGHSRAGQFFFGGATRSLLHAEEAPALALAH